MKTYNYLFGTTMILSVMLLTSCQKDSIIEPSNSTPTHTPWEGSAGTVYQIELDLNTSLTVEKLDCSNDHLPKDNEPNTVNHDCELTYTAYGSVEGFSSTLGESKGSVELRYNQITKEVYGFVTMSYPNTNDELVLSMHGLMDDETLKVGSVNSFVGMDFSGDVTIDNILDVFIPNTQISTSMMIVGEMK